MGLGNRVNEYAEREPRRFAVAVMIFLMIPLFAAFALWFLWAAAEFFRDQPSFDYYFWLGLIVGAGGAFWVGAAMFDLWKKRIARPVNESRAT